MDVPKLIGNRFELGSFLSQGGMGAVYRGRDTQTDNIVAIKQLKPDLLASDPDLVRRFVAEGEALRALNHPNIVKLLAAVEDDGQYYLIMEYVSGGSLEDLLRKTPRLPVARVLAIALELADALTRAHHLKIIHRDIKPANVLLAEDGTPRLTDFGVARVGESDTTRNGTVIGTVGYVCPEALHGEALDARADLWSFGVMLYEMLAGRRPFGGSSTAAVVGAILNQRTPDLEASRPDAPVALVDLIYRMLEKSREQRIPSARLVGAELEGVIRYNWPTDANRLPQPIDAIPAILPDDLAGETIRPEKSPVTPIIALQNLPAQTTPFVGREAELIEIAKLLSTPGVRLVTILGPGGMGKTRLALEAAEAQLDHFANGVYFVNLAPLTSPESILTAVAEAVRFQFYQGAEPKQQLLDYFREKHALLLMDNFGIYWQALTS